MTTEQICAGEKKRLALIEQLKVLDRNGVWSDVDSKNEEMDPLTLEQAEEYVKKLSNPE